MILFLANVSGDLAVLDEDESHHCARVLRKRAGDEIRVIDGGGNFYDVQLGIVSDKQCSGAVVAGPFPETPRDYRLHLAVAPTKQVDRIEWMLEKAVEIGLDEISFIRCERSERTVLKTERLHKIALSAVKQSLGATLPVIQPLAAFTDFVSRAEADQKFIAWCEGSERMELRDQKFIGRSTIILIGPEGDFTATEAALAQQKGFVHLSLGSRRLRTETAALTAVQAAALL